MRARQNIIQQFLFEKRKEKKKNTHTERDTINCYSFVQ